jgi:hypothetical protein
MKLLRSISALCLMALFAFAGSDDRLRVTLPHAIVVGGNHLAAGDYAIRTLDTGADSSVLVFESLQSHVHVAVITSRVPNAVFEPPAKTELVLERDGDTYRLEEIRIADKPYRFEFLPAR